MRSEWKKITIDDIAEKVAMGPFGSNIKVETFVDKGIPIISGNHLRRVVLEDKEYNFITEEHAEKLKNSLVYHGDIVFTHAGNVGQVAYIPQDSKYKKYIISQRQFYMRCNKKLVIPEFLAYWFHSRLGQHKLLANVSQVGVPSIARPSSYLKTIEIDLPHINEQNAIVKMLLSLDDKIELNNRMNANLEAQAQAIFKSWFVDFEPFGGTMPDDWKEGTLGDIIELYDSKRIPLSGNQREKMQKTYPYYGAASLMDYVEDYLFDGVYLLLGEDGTVIDDSGFPILQYVWGKFWVNNHAHILQGKNGFTTESLYVFLKQTSVSSIVTGAVQPKINQANLKSISVIIPVPEQIDKFNTLIAPFFAQLRKNRNENKNLTTLRDSLLPKLMSGEIEVPVAEEMIKKGAQ